MVGAVIGAIAGLLLGSMGDDRRAAAQPPRETSRGLKLGRGGRGLVRPRVDL